MDFNIVINQIIILFILMICGYVVRRLNIIDGHFIKGLSGLLLKVTLPALIISSMQLGQLSSDVIKDLLLLVSISIGTYALAILLAIIIPKIIKVSQRQLGLYQFILVFANVGFLGYPLVEAILGKEALFYAAIFNLPFNFFVYTLGYYYMSKGMEEQEKFSYKKFINPGVVAVLIGLVLLIFDIKLPYAIGESIDIVGGLTTPLSMIIVGGLLVNIKLKSLFSDLKLYGVCIYRLILFPLVVLVILKLIFKDTLHPYVLAIPVIISALPVAVNAAILAEQWDQDGDLASKSIFISTLLCIVTVPGMAYLIQLF